MESLKPDNPLLLEEKYRFLQTASKTNTLGTIIGPVLSAVLVYQEAHLPSLLIWLAVMTVSVLFRAYMVFFRNRDETLTIQRKIFNLNLGVFTVTSTWGLGWLIVVPGLPFNLQCLYMLMSSTAIFVGLYGYSINRNTFLCFALPIFICQFIVSLIPPLIFPWPIMLGEFAFSLYTLKMASYFSDSWVRNVSLQIQNQMLNRDLEEERNVAIAANVAKSKFIATASHDLRQPLHAVNIYIDLFEPRNFNPEDRANFAQIRKSVQSLNSMFNSLLDLSKLDSGASENRSRSFDVQELVAALSSTYTPIANNKNLALHFEATNMQVEGDHRLLQQLLGNIISNAIQYSIEGGVLVEFSVRNQCLKIKVQDTGCGMDASSLEKIFDEFFRVDTTRSMHDGLGLGLSIVKRLCKIAHAELLVHSEVGVGTTFNIQTQYPVILLNKPGQGHDYESTFEASASPDALTAPKYIAVFEDDPTIFNAYEKALTQNGFKVLALSENSAEMARELAHINHIDCILSDYRLTTTTGDLIIQQLRDSFGVNIPAIIITADTSPQHIQLFKELNINVLYKPVGYGDIVGSIQSLL
jgi:signal transduction histidine kinase/CheY-like chemotaxis protein